MSALPGGQRDAPGVPGQGRDRAAERGGDRREQPRRAGDEVDGRRPVTLGGEPQRQEPEATAQLDDVRAERERGGAVVDGSHAGVGPAGFAAVAQGGEGVAVEGGPAGVDVAHDADERVLEAGGVEQAGGDEVVGDPVGEVVAELVYGRMSWRTRPSASSWSRDR